MEQYIHYVVAAVVGLIAGFLGSQIVDHKGEGLLWDILIGVLGSVVGGWVAARLGFDLSGNYGLNLRSILAATAGAVVILLVWHALVRAMFFGKRRI